MAQILNTVFQNIDKAISGNWNDMNQAKHNNTYDLSQDTVVYKAHDKADYAKNKLELQQNSWLQDRWIKANVDLTVQAFTGLNNIKLMYRDADLMDSFPEIGAALNILAQESTITNNKGQIITVSSKSERIKAILEDLFVNRLDIQITAEMIIRQTCKYGNQFMLLNVDNKNGVLGWRQLPVFSVERLENGIENPYSNIIPNMRDNGKGERDMSTKFIWTDETSSQIPFRNWQVAHFRLINNSMYLPYGVSILNSARRHWRMLSLMEDMMLIYRLERSIERRVYKIYVGAIDDADVQAYVQEIANNFKRTPIIDPMTGQIDLRKNIMDVSQDLFIPVRDQNAPTPIDTLPAAQNISAIDDINYIQRKVLTALNIPKSFINFDEAAGNGQNLALMDVRFTRTINRIQQAFLMELTKVASIHLYLLGFTDDLTNFSLAMNNPSTQAEQLEIDNITKKISAIQTAVADPGGGIPIMSLQRALKEIMKWSDKEIQENLEELRLEKALAQELAQTSQIIQKTGIFDNVDRIYGEPGAKYQQGQAQGQDGGMGGGPMGGGAAPPPPAGGGPEFGDGLDSLGAPGSDDSGDISGAEGEMPIEDAASGGDMPPSGGDNLMESQTKKQRTLSDYKKNGAIMERVKIYNDSLFINEEFDSMLKSIDKFLED